MLSCQQESIQRKHVSKQEVTWDKVRKVLSDLMIRREESEMRNFDEVIRDRINWIVCNSSVYVVTFVSNMLQAIFVRIKLSAVAWRSLALAVSLIVITSIWNPARSSLMTFGGSRELFVIQDWDNNLKKRTAKAHRSWGIAILPSLGAVGSPPVFNDRQFTVAKGLTATCLSIKCHGGRQ
jgi:hypothetical protein